MNRVRTYHRGYAAATLLYFGFLATIVWLANAGIARSQFNQAEAVFGGDKIAHAFLMGLFAFLLINAWPERKITRGPFSMMTGSLVAYVLVLGEEFSQHWQARRTPDPLDALFDIIGIFIFARLANANIQLKSKKGEPAHATN